MDTPRDYRTRSLDLSVIPNSDRLGELYVATDKVQGFKWFAYQRDNCYWIAPSIQYGVGYHFCSLWAERFVFNTIDNERVSQELTRTAELDLPQPEHRAWRIGQRLCRAYAYLIAVCNDTTNAIEQVAIWSSPEWEQSRCLPNKHTYVAYRVSGDTFQLAINILREQISDPRSRYHYLHDILARQELEATEALCRLDAIEAAQALTT